MRPATHSNTGFPAHFRPRQGRSGFLRTAAGHLTLSVFSRSMDCASAEPLRASYLHRPIEFYFLGSSVFLSARSFLAGFLAEPACAQPFWCPRSSLAASNVVRVSFNSWTDYALISHGLLALAGVVGGAIGFWVSAILRPRWTTSGLLCGHDQRFTAMGCFSLFGGVGVVGGFLLHSDRGRRMRTECSVIVGLELYPPMGYWLDATGFRFSFLSMAETLASQSPGLQRKNGLRLRCSYRGPRPPPMEGGGRVFHRITRPV